MFFLFTVRVDSPHSAYMASLLLDVEDTPDDVANVPYRPDTIKFYKEDCEGQWVRGEISERAETAQDVGTVCFRGCA